MINCLSILNLFVLVWKLLLKILTLQKNFNILKPRFLALLSLEKKFPSTHKAYIWRVCLEHISK